MNSLARADRTLALAITFTFVMGALMAGCGEFESPVLVAQNPSEVPDDPADVTPPPAFVLPCSIRPTSARHGLGVGEYLLQTHLSGAAYEQFVVLDPSETPMNSIDFRWSVAGPDGEGAGALPPGLSLDPDTGQLHGTVTADGEFAFSIAAESARLGPALDTVVRCQLTELTVKVAPACQTDDDCVLDGLDDLNLECNEDAFKAHGGGVCTKSLKQEMCPATNERFQVWLNTSTAPPQGKALTFTGTVFAHDECFTTTFSLDDGGQSGFCLDIEPDDSGDAGMLVEEGELITLAYRLPSNYPMPVEAGRPYRFVYMRGGVFDGGHYADGTLLVFAETGDEARDRPLVFGAHTGRVLPDDLMRRCFQHGVCPRILDSHIAPTTCPAVSSSPCGHRTPTMLVVETKNESGSGEPLLIGQSPVHLGSKDGSAGYALHLAVSDTFVGDEALRCAGDSDDYRLSYLVLPERSCLLTRLEPLGGTAVEAPARLIVQLTDEFSPSGAMLDHRWETETEPAANTLFESNEPTVDNEQARDYTAYVPGYYQYRILPDDGDGTESCGQRDTVRFAVEPSTSTYVELSHAAPADIELRLAPVLTGWGVFTGLDRDKDGVVATLDNPAPGWDGVDAAAAALWQAEPKDLRPGAGVQTFGANEGLAGMYRVGVLRRDDSDDSPVTVDLSAERRGVDVGIRVVLERNLDGTVELAANLDACDFWEIGILDFDESPPRLISSPHPPTDLCAPVETPVENPETHTETEKPTETEAEASSGRQAPEAKPDALEDFTSPYRIQL